MAMEYKLPITASELSEKILSIDKKADLVDGKVPTEQLPENIGVQSDFNQNDDTQPDYIKNRIAYSNGVKTIDVLNKTFTLAYNEDMGVYMAMVEGLSDKDIAYWKSFSDITIVWDGTSYEVSKIFFPMGGAYFWGNAMMAGLEDSGEPFVVAIADNDGEDSVLMIMSLTDAAPDDPSNAPTIDHAIEISYQEDNVYTDSKYFNMDNILTVKNGDIIHEKTKYIFELEESTGLGLIETEGKFFLPPAGKKIKVYWDGVEYSCTIISIPESDGMVGVGSVDALINEDLSLVQEPFVIATNNTNSYIMYSLGANLAHELKIVAEDECQITIDSKYLDIPLNYDDYPISGSENLLTSDAIYRALGYRNSISIVGTVNSWSSDPVSSQAVYNALGQREQLTIDSDVNSYSTNPVSSQAVYNALGNKQDKLTIDSSVISGSNNPVSSQAVYKAIQNIDLSSKQDKINVSSSDNGKFMRVVNGAWAAVAVPNAEEALF